MLLGLAGVAVLPASAAHANVENFSYASWSAEYSLTLDGSGRAVAHVTETLVARFPDYDQNRGIVRGLATSFRGANLHTRVISVTDERGNPVNWWTEDGDGELRVLLGTDEFVHGLTTYVIEYEMRDVMIAGGDDGRDEFYWNLLPTQSLQPVESFWTAISFSPELTAAFTGDAACYQGREGSTDRCELRRAVEGYGVGMRFVVESGPRAARDIVTVAFGFEPGTVAQPLARQVGPVTDVAPFVALGGAGIAMVGGGIALSHTRRRARTATGIIIAQYEVSPSLPPLLAAPLYPGATNVIPAQIVHLAVRGALRIEHIEKRQRPTLHLTAPGPSLEGLDAALRDRLFAAGTSITLPARSESFAKSMRALQAQGVTAAERQGLLAAQRSRGARLAFWIALGLLAAGMLIGLFGAVMGRPEAEPALFITGMVGVFVLIFALGFGAKHKMHTHRGAEVYEHLAGVREFIRVAEADRLRMLQSVQGAERYRSGSVELVHLYERLLPYAMLFGLERSWGQVLEVAYQSSGSNPVWMGGYSSGFGSNLASFSSSTQASSSYSASSSGGGSGGGGSSGGGGGGGSSGGR